MSLVRPAPGAATARGAAHAAPAMVAGARRLGALALLWVAVLAALGAGRVAAFGAGDFVPCARRAQFHGKRTQWLDLLGRHCPRFGAAASAAMPLEMPEDWKQDDTYKVSMSFAHDRFQTPWLAVIGPGLTHLPLVDVVLTHSGGELRSVSARLYELEDSFPALARHPEVAEHYRNVSHWPKHLLVHYRWIEDVEVDAAGGMFTLLGVGAVLATVVMGAVVLESRHQLVRLAADVSAPGGGASAGGGTFAGDSSMTSGMSRNTGGAHKAD